MSRDDGQRNCHQPVELRSPTFFEEETAVYNHAQNPAGPGLRTAEFPQFSRLDGSVSP